MGVKSIIKKIFGIKDDLDCLRCGNGKGKFCKECYNKAITENLKIQIENLKYQEEHRAIKKIIEQKNKYIKDLEHIRDCYYKEIAVSIEERKIFKNIPSKELTKNQKWEVEKEIEKRGRVNEN